MALNAESIFEHSDEEIDVVSVDPNDERIINFDLLTRYLSSDYDEESDYPTDTDSDIEEAMIDVVNTSTISAEINNNETNVSTLQDESISLDETVRSYEEPSSKLLKRKRKNSDDSAMKTRKRKKISEIQSNNLWDYFDKSISESGKAATPQEQRTLSTSTEISLIKSPKNESGPVKCPICDRTYKSKGSLQSHLKLGCKSLILECCFCSFATKQTREMDLHLQSEHMEQLNTIEEIKHAYKKIFRNRITMQDKLKCIVLSCPKCKMRTTVLDEKSDECCKCMTNFVFSCEECSEQLPGLRGVLGHLNKNCGIKYYYCNHCDSRFSVKTKLARHLRTVHTMNEPVECPTCHGIFKHEDSLRVHRITCSKPPHLLCCFCSFTAKQIANIKRHLTAKHMDQFVTIDELKAACNKISTNAKAIGTSGKEQSVGNLKCVVLTCTNCNLTIKETGRCPEKCPKCKSNFAFSCNHCDSMDSWKHNPEKHVRDIHMDTKPVECPSKSEVDLQYDTRTYCKSPHLVCCFCSFETKQVQEMCLHLESKHSEQSHAIEELKDVYKKIFENGITMQDKLKYIVLSCPKCEMVITASDEKTDKCSKCMTNFTFSCEQCSEQLSGLLEALDHLNKRCEFKYYYCYHCDSNFNDKYKLVRHLHAMHARTKVVECPICHSIFERQKSFKRHIATCSKPPHLRCCFCPFAVKTNVIIKRHLKIMHLDQIGTTEELEAVYKEIFRNGKAICMGEKPH